MTTVYTLVSWLAILGYWLLIAGVTLRILMKRRAVPSAMAWLLIIYILPLVGISKPDANPSACRTHLSGRFACVIAPGP